MARLFDDASSQYLRGDISTIVNDVPVSMAAWIYTDINSINQVPVGLFTAAVEDNRIYMTVDSASKFSAVYHNNVYGIAATTASYSVNTWHHICGVFSAGNSRSVYMDGGSKVTNTTSITPFPSSLDRFSVGVADDSSPTAYMSGRVAEAAVWELALSDEEVAALGKGFCPLLVRPCHLTHYVSLVRDHDLDTVGGLRLTAGNSPTVADHPRIIYPTQPYYPRTAYPGRPWWYYQRAAMRRAC